MPSLGFSLRGHGCLIFPWQSVQCWDRRGKEIVFVKLIIAVLGFLTQTETVFSV